MGLLLLAALLAGTPATLVAPVEPVHYVFTDQARLGTAPSAASRRQVEEAVAKAGRSPHDVGPIYRALFNVGMLVPDFQRAPPPGWPAALEEDWRLGHARCAARVGPAPKEAHLRLSAARTAVECQGQLARALYGRYLDHLGAKQVLEVTVAETEGGASPPVTATAVLFDPGGDGQARQLSLSAPRAAVVEKVGELTRRALGGEGTALRYQLDRALPAALR